MHAYIITRSDEEGRMNYVHSMLKDWHVSGHDTVTLEPQDNTIGIDAVRSTISRLSFKPRSSPFSVLVVRMAHTLSEEAQQAILKTLEEPVGKSRIIVETQEPYSLLPTILSRCHIVRLTDAQATDQSNTELSLCVKTLEQLLHSSVGERHKLIDTLTKTRDDALIFVDRAIGALRKELVHTGAYAKLLRALLTARTQLLGNANPKLTLDAVFLS